MGEEVALIAGFPSETLCIARAGMGGVSSGGKLVLWVGETVHHEKKERKKPMVDGSRMCAKCIVRTLPLKQTHFSLLNIKMQTKLKGVLHF